MCLCVHVCVCAHLHTRECRSVAQGWTLASRCFSPVSQTVSRLSRLYRLDGDKILTVYWTPLSRSLDLPALSLFPGE